MKLFLSYRRADTQDLAGRIVDRLRAVPRIERVFMDVDGIEPGAKFEEKIQAALAASDVCILLIGPRWRGDDPEREVPRIFEDRDFVRREAAAALASERKVLPALANDARMPEADELPDDLRVLPALNALSIRHLSFDRDVEHLVDVVLSRKKPGRSVAYLQAHPVQAALVRALLGAVCAGATLLGGAAVHGAMVRRSLEESLGGQGQVWLLIAGAVVIGALTAALIPGRRKRPRSS